MAVQYCERAAAFRGLGRVRVAVFKMTAHGFVHFLFAHELYRTGSRDP